MVGFVELRQRLESMRDLRDHLLRIYAAYGPQLIDPERLNVRENNQLAEKIAQRLGKDLILDPAVVRADLKEAGPVRESHLLSNPISQKLYEKVVERLADHLSKQETLSVLRAGNLRYILIEHKKKKGVGCFVAMPT